MNEEEKLPKRQLILVGIAVLLTGILLIVKPSHSVFQVNKTINIMDAKVGNFANNKIVDGDKITIKVGDINVDYDVNMIPVVFDSIGQTVRADETNTDSTYYWFDYCQNKESSSYNYKSSGCTFRWANIVLVSDTNREIYKNASPGTLVNESDILAYFVYVPRYRYQLFNANNGTTPEQTINIEFENKTTPPVCGGNTCTTNRLYSTGTNDEWLTHPAFTFGTTELNGIWTGKFDLSADENSVCGVSPSWANCHDTVGISITPRIKPNRMSWRYIDIVTLYTVSKYFKSNLLYGINNSSIDAHMIKNMEWGAVAYLSQSIYGKRGNQGTPIFPNNYMLLTSGYPYPNLTGCSATTSGAYQANICAYPYPHENGVEASTTGSLYGAYDMVGNLTVWVMGNMVASGQVAPGPLNAKSGGFNGTTYPYPESKYYDSYTYGTTTNDATAFARGYLGDATKEILTCLNTANCGWGGSYSRFVYFVGGNDYIWFYHGATLGIMGFFGNQNGNNMYFGETSHSVLVVE